MAQASVRENIIDILIQHDITDKDVIEPERITGMYPCSCGDYKYIECNLDENKGTGHTIILVEDEDGDSAKKLEYFYRHDNQEPGLKIFGDVIGYTTFRHEKGTRVDGTSFVLKHGSRWHNSINHRFDTQSIMKFNTTRKFYEAVNQEYVESTRYYEHEEIDIKTQNPQNFEFEYKGQKKQIQYFEAMYKPQEQKIYCILVENEIEYAVSCIEQMFQNPKITSVISKIIAASFIDHLDKKSFCIIAKAK